MGIDTLAKAKAALILDQPFFASLLLSMPMKVDNSIKTMATNGDEILYNTAFMNSLSLPETIFVLGHEVMHCVLQHMHRRGNRNQQKWNIAADYVINETLNNEKIGVMPKGCLLDSSLVKQGNGTSEGVYDLLPDQPSDNNNNGQGNGSSSSNPGNDLDQPGNSCNGALDEVRDAGIDQAQTSQKEAEMRVKIVQAANAARMCGKLSAGIERMVKEMTATRTDWKSVLRRFLSERAKVDLSYAKPKRRFLADDIYLPSLIGEAMGGIVIAVDCSGSIDDKLLAEFTAEIKAIKTDVNPSIVHVVYFDSEVLKAESFSPDDSLTITPCGGGGTAFSPVFKYIDEKQLAPCACVFLTDLCCSDFGDAPEYPVLWASTDNGCTPFGETVLIKE